MKTLRYHIKVGDTVTVTQSSHHFVPLSSSQIGHKLTSKDESYVDIHDFSLPTLFEIGDISPSACVTCIYNWFWCVGMVSLVVRCKGDVININFIYPHGSRKTFN